MINLIYTLDGAATVIERDVPISTSGKYGQAVSIAEGKLAKSQPTDFPYAILLADNAAEVTSTEYIHVRTDQVFEVDVEGDIKTLEVGKQYGMDATATKLDVSASEGKMLVMRVDPVKKKATVRFIK